MALREVPIVKLAALGWKYATGIRAWYVCYLIMFVIAQSVELFIPFLLGKLLNAVQLSSSTAQAFDHICYFSVLMLVAYIGFWAFHFPARYLEMVVAFKVRINYRRHLFNSVAHLPLAWHRARSSGEIIDRIQRASAGLHAFLADGFQILYALTNFIVVLLLLTYFMPIFGIFAVVISLLTFISISLVDRILNRNYTFLNQAENSISAALTDYIHHIATITTFALQSEVVQKFSRQLETPYVRFKKHAANHELKWLIMSVWSIVLLLGVPIGYGYYAVSLEQEIMAGSFLMLFEYLRRITGSFFSFSLLYGVVLRQVSEVQMVEPLEVAFRAILLPEKESASSRRWHEIAIKDLSYRYISGEGSRSQLQHIHITLSPGRKIALVGRSGSGKSTLLKVMAGVIDGASASTRIDGVLVPGGLSDIGSLVTLVPQEPEIFLDTASFNISFGRESGDSRLERAVYCACFESVSQQLPHGLETHLDEKGVNLSGGERQRLALARGLFLAPEETALLLDEATSSVDVASENQIFDRLWSLLGHRCIVAAIHRLHLLERFDYIYVMQAGQIVEHGSYCDLMSKQGVLAELWKHYQADQIVL